ncbi:hypothetical protein AOLI_G00073330 [Acnodon oligacanthus]
MDIQRALEVLSGEDEDEGQVSSAAESVDTDEELDFEAGIDPAEESDEPGEVLVETNTSSDLLLQRGGDGQWVHPRFTLRGDTDAAETICQNTNKQAAKNMAKGKKYKWTDVVVEEFYKFLGIIMFTALVPLNHISDFGGGITSSLFPAAVMSRDRQIQSHRVERSLE